MRLFHRGDRVEIVRVDLPVAQPLHLTGKRGRVFNDQRYLGVIVQVVLDVDTSEVLRLWSTSLVLIDAVTELGDLVSGQGRTTP